MSEAITMILDVLSPSYFMALTSVVIAAVTLGVVWYYRDDRAGNRHFILLTGLLIIAGSMALSWLLRSVTGVSDDMLGLIAQRAVRTPTAWLVIWGIGGGLLMLRLVVGYAAVQEMISTGRRVEGGRIARALEHARYRCRVERAVQVCLSPRCRSPLTTGLSPALVILPDDAEMWDDRKLHAVLLHEVGHIGRNDCLTQLIIQVLGICCWWNPLFWIAALYERRLREHACDELVMSNFVSPAAYATMLLEFARQRPTLASTSLATVPMAARSGLPDRIREIVSERGSRVLNWHTMSRGDVVWCAIVISMLMPMIDVFLRPGA